MWISPPRPHPAGNRFHLSLPAVMLVVLLGSSSPLPAAEPTESSMAERTEPAWPEFMNRPRHPAPNLRPDLLPSRVDGDWQAIIDATWGPGDPVEQMEVFTLWRNTLDHNFSCYSNHDVDIAALCNPLWDEIYPDGVSRGRFQAILQKISRAHQNSHSICIDIGVHGTKPEPGVPTLVIPSGIHTTFGASLTVHEDGIFVYNVVPDHPLDLELGDVILGYDGVPWEDLYPQLLEAGLPVNGLWGTSDAAYAHHWLKAAGQNWHLFDTIDIRKYGSGDIQHLPTSLLVDPGMSMVSLGFENLDLGFSIPWAPDWTVRGVLERGKLRVGYIFVLSWADNVEAAFRDACAAMMDDPDLDGLIIDFRTVWGGNMYLSNDGLSLLFNQDVLTVDFATRSDPDDHLAMEPDGHPGIYRIHGDPGSYFNKPIAVLTGPGAASSGDQVALRMTYHPMVRTFGKPTSATFDSPVMMDMTAHPDFGAQFSQSESYRWDTPGQYLTHVGFPVDEEVWLEPDDVVQGIDTVVEKAVAWIATGNPPRRELVITGAGPGQDNTTAVHGYDPLNSSAPALVITPYGVERYGTNVATADLDGDRYAEILTGPGPGAVFGPHVRGFEPDATQLPGLNFLAYGTNKYGVNVAGGDLDGDGRAEIITGAGPGAVFGPHVRGFCYDGAAVTPVPGISFFAYGTPKWGVNVCTGDLDGDRMAEIITGAGPGAVYGPHVRGWNVDGGSAVTMPGVNFLAYGTNKYGVNVAAGDIDGDGFDEIITGAGPGAVFGPHVRGWNYDNDTLAAFSGISFFAFEYTEWGVNVSCGDVDGDGIDEILAASGPGATYEPMINIYTWDGSALTMINSFTAYPDDEVTHGVKAAIGRFDAW